MRPGRAADHTPTSSAAVMERAELYLYPPSGPHRAFNGITLPFTCYSCGPGRSVGIATDYGLDGPGSNPGGDEIFRQGSGSFPGVKCGWGVLLTTHPLLVLRSWKE